MTNFVKDNGALTNITERRFHRLDDGWALDLARHGRGQERLDGGKVGGGWEWEGDEVRRDSPYMPEHSLSRK